MTIDRIIPPVTLLAVILMLSVWDAGVSPLALCLATATLCAGLALSIHFRTAACRTTNLRLPLYGVIGITALLLVMLSGLPMPGKLDSATGAKRYQQNTLVRNAVQKLDLHDQHFALTRNRAGTLRIVLLVAAMLCSAALVSLQTPADRRVCIWGTVAIVFAVAVIGFLHQWIWPAPNTLWWFNETPHARHPVGCFVNRTHFAGFVALSAPALLAASAWMLAARRTIPAILVICAFAAMNAVIVLSLARGAVIAVMIANVVVLGVVWARLSWRSGLAVACALVVLAAATISLSLLPGAERVRRVAVQRLSSLQQPFKTDSANARIGVWKDAIAIVRSYPMVGAGANAFRFVFPQHRTSSDRESFKQAENEYVEFIADFGLLGVLILFALLLSLAAECRAIVSGMSRDPFLATAATGALIVAALHNAVDFPLHAPLYAIVLASFAGILLPATEATGTPGNTEDRVPPAPGQLSIPVNVATLCLAAAALASLALYLPGRGVYFVRDSSDHITAAQSDPQELATILAWAPTSWQAWYHAGKYACSSGNRDLFKAGEEFMTVAAGYDPNNYRLWEALGNIRAEAGDHEGAAAAYNRMSALRPWKKPPPARKEGAY